ncbi:hypothetical protein JTB14_031172 [Gonioctena quinquepunctata]|nr:hypothetical protein JTB14_031172 [Gonioctena quinquepunctata]
MNRLKSESKKEPPEKSDIEERKKITTKTLLKMSKQKNTKSIKTASNDEMSSNGVENVHSSKSCTDSLPHTNIDYSEDSSLTSNGTDTKSESMPTKRLWKRRYEKLDDSYENDISLEDPFADSGDDGEYVPSSESHIFDSLIDDMNSDESLKLKGNTHEIIVSSELKKKQLKLREKLMK